eukprot:SAG11_NODE_1710_length_4406_cov_16.728581_2_plen_370_part_00
MTSGVSLRAACRFEIESAVVRWLASYDSTHASRACDSGAVQLCCYELLLFLVGRPVGALQTEGRADQYSMGDGAAGGPADLQADLLPIARQLFAAGASDRDPLISARCAHGLQLCEVLAHARARPLYFVARGTGGITALTPCGDEAVVEARHAPSSAPGANASAFKSGFASSAAVGCGLEPDGVTTLPSSVALPLISTTVTSAAAAAAEELDRESEHAAPRKQQQQQQQQQQLQLQQQLQQPQQQPPQPQQQQQQQPQQQQPPSQQQQSLAQGLSAVGGAEIDPSCPDSPRAAMHQESDSKDSAKDKKILQKRFKAEHSTEHDGTLAETAASEPGQPKICSISVVDESPDEDDFSDADENSDDGEAETF